MTLLRRGHVIASIIAYFCTRKFLKKLQFRIRTTYWLHALIIFIIVVFQLGGLHYRLCYGIKFIITLNEGLGLVATFKTKLLDFSQVLLMNC